MFAKVIFCQKRPEKLHGYNTIQKLIINTLTIILTKNSCKNTHVFRVKIRTSHLRRNTQSKSARNPKFQTAMVNPTPVKNKRNKMAKKILEFFPADLTRKKKETEKLFEESVEGFFKVFNSSPGGMTITEQGSSALVEVNNMFTSLFGISRYDALGKTTLELGIIDPKELERVRALRLIKGQLENDEIKCRDRNGQLLHCLVTTMPISLNHRHYTLTSFNDITKIREQSTLIAEQHRRLFEGVSYAKEIQEAILPPKDLITRIIPQSFVLYKPKDIVSGDFYWIESTGSRTYVAAADCTGHGVPGALMSIIGFNLLNKSVNDDGHKTPAEILNDLSIGIYRALRQNTSDATLKDSINISMVCIDHNTGTLEYAGALNPVYIIQGNELVRLPADRFPVGWHFSPMLQEFTSHKFRVMRGDSIYLFTDGYADQFGGPSGKKFKINRFQQLLLSIQHLSMKEQGEILNETIEQWKGDREEQVDDILVIGIRI